MSLKWIREGRIIEHGDSHNENRTYNFLIIMSKVIPLYKIPFLSKFIFIYVVHGR